MLLVSGIVKTGEEIEIVGMKEGVTKSTVTGVEMFKKQLNQVGGGEWTQRVRGGGRWGKGARGLKVFKKQLNWVSTSSM